MGPATGSYVAGRTVSHSCERIRSTDTGLGKSWPESGASRLVYPAIHGTFHALTRRLDAIANEGGLSAVESLVVSVAAAHPMEGIFAIRHATGLRPSTLNSILNRLENRDLLR